MIGQRRARGRQQPPERGGKVPGGRKTIGQRRSPGATWTAGSQAAPTSPSCRRGFSLLEVVLALAILTGAIAVLGELVRAGARNAQIARDLTQAQLLCEIKLAEITAGIEVPEPVARVPFPAETGSAGPRSDTADWFFSIEVEPLEQEELLAVRVTVEQDSARARRPVAFSLVRWMHDPGVELPAASPSQGASGTSSSAEARR